MRHRVGFLFTLQSDSWDMAPRVWVPPKPRTESILSGHFTSLKLDTKSLLIKAQQRVRVRAKSLSLGGRGRGAGFINNEERKENALTWLDSLEGLLLEF